MKSTLLFSTILLLYSPLAAEFKGNLFLEGKPFTGAVTVERYERARSLSPDDWSEPELIEVENDGTFTVSEINDNTQFEVYGPVIRRSRFTWPKQDDQFGSNVSFALRHGITSTGTLLSQSGEPLPNAMIGPVLPYEAEGEAEGIALNPFYTTSDEDGTVSLQGLIHGVTYQVYFTADGYEWDERLVLAGEGFSWTLPDSTSTFSGSVIGSFSSEPTADHLVAFESQTSPFRLIARTNEEGRFDVSGLPSDNYLVYCYDPTAPSLQGVEVTLDQNQVVEDFILFSYEGVLISGSVQDQETFDALENVSVTLGDLQTKTDQFGNFSIGPYRGSWPAKPNFSLTGYRFSEANQPSETYPVLFEGEAAVSGLNIKLQKDRNLLVKSDLLADENAEDTAILQLSKSSEERTQKTYQQLWENEQLYPLNSAGDYSVFAQSTTRGVTDLVSFTATDTTSTIELSFGPGAQLVGGLTYDQPANESDIPTYRIEVKNSKGHSVSESKPDEQGGFRFDELPPGNFTVELQRPDGNLWLPPQSVELKRSETAQLNLQVMRGGDLILTVQNEAEDPLPMASVELYGVNSSGDSFISRQITNDLGVVQFNSLALDQVQSVIFNHADHEKVTTEYTLYDTINEETQTLTPKGGIDVFVNASSTIQDSAEVLLLRGKRVGGPDGKLQNIYDIESRVALRGEDSVSLLPRFSGDYCVAAGFGESWDVSAPFDWSSSNDDKTITLTPGVVATFEVSVSGVEKEVLEKWEVDLVSTSFPETYGFSRERADSYSNGKMIFRNIIPGTYFFTAYDDLYGAESITNIVFEGGKSKTVQLDMSLSGYELFGNIVAERSDEGVIASVMIQYADVPESPVLYEGTSDSSGRFSYFPLLHSRPYLITVTSPDQKEQFILQPMAEMDDERDEVFLMEEMCFAQIRVPSVLEEMFKQSPQLPLILLNQATRDSVVLSQVQLNESVAIKRGIYAVMLGEAEIGTLKLEKCGDKNNPIIIAIDPK